MSTNGYTAKLVAEVRRAYKEALAHYTGTGASPMEQIRDTYELNCGQAFAIADKRVCSKVGDRDIAEKLEDIGDEDYADEVMALFSLS